MNEIRFRVGRGTCSIGMQYDHRKSVLYFENFDVFDKRNEVYLKFVGRKQYLIPILNMTLDITRPLTEYSGTFDAQLEERKSDGSLVSQAEVFQIHIEKSVKADAEYEVTDERLETIYREYNRMYNVIVALEEDLIQKRDSGFFKGEKGDKGDPGHDGHDYVITESDYDAIAERTKELVPPYDDTELREALSGKVGDVKINGTSIKTDGVVNIPIAKAGGAGTQAGVVAFSTAFEVDNTNRVQLNPASVSDINGNPRASTKVITPSNIDYAVRRVMGDGKGAEWTADEKANARERMGVVEYDDTEIREEVSQLSETIAEVSDKVIEDKFTEYRVDVVEKKILHATGSINDYNDASWKVTAKIPVIGVDKIKINYASSNYGNAICCFYDASDMCISSATIKSSSVYTEILGRIVEVPSNATYVILATCRYANNPSVSLSDGKQLKPSFEINPLYGKKLSVNGDSICYGLGSSGGYGKIIADRNGMAFQNVAVSGGTITAETYEGTTPRHWICRTINNMDADADYILLEGGTNDSGIATTKGALTQYLDSPLDDTTYYGALESMCKQLVKRFQGKKYGFIIVHRTSTRLSPLEKDNSYYTPIFEACAKWGVPVLDLNIQIPQFGSYTTDQALIDMRNRYTNNGDGVHPTKEGYEKYYCDKIESFLKSL